MKKRVFPYIAATISSPTRRQLLRSMHELKRRVRQDPHEVSAYVRVNDPYCWLLMQALPEMAERFQVEWVFRTVLHLEDDMYPEQAMWHANAMADCRHLAALYGLEFPEQASMPDDTISRWATRILLSAEGHADFVGIALQVFRAAWNKDRDTLVNLESQYSLTTPEADERLADNEQDLQQRGHYMSATLYYQGEWYWGLDRLDHLERRLLDKDLLKPGAAQTQPVYTKTYAELGQLISPAEISEQARKEPVVMYFSARSPYSYLGLERVVELCKRYNMALDIKPVLPMLMRGMAVPDDKKMYIFLDTKREAEKLSIPYGFLADPLGEGVERCYALFDYAKKENRAVEFLLSFARGVNAEGIHSHTDAGLKRIVERAGLDWSKAQPLLQNQMWRAWAQSNLDEMFSLGLWGVPCYRYGDAACWGQDRLFIIERAIAERSRAAAA